MLHQQSSPRNEGLAQSISVVAQSYRVVEDQEGLWRCYLDGACVTIAAVGDDTCAVEVPLADVALHDAQTLENVLAFSNYLSAFERSRFVLCPTGGEGQGLWRRGCGLLVRYQYCPKLYPPESLASVIEEALRQASDIMPVVRDLVAGRYGVFEAVRRRDPLVRLMDFVERTKEMGGANLVEEEPVREGADGEVPEPASLYPQARPPYLDTKVMSFRTKTVGDAVGELDIRDGSALRVEMSHSPYGAQLTVQIGKAANAERAALGVARKAVADMAWANVCVHPIRGDVVYSVLLTAGVDLTCDEVDGVLAEAAVFARENEREIESLLGQPLTRVWHTNGDDGDSRSVENLRYALAHRCFCSGVVHAEELDGSEYWMGGDRVCVLIQPDFVADKVRMDVCTWIEVEAASLAVIQELRRAVGNYHGQGRLAWVMRGVSSERLCLGSSICLRFVYDLGDLLEEDGLERAINCVEGEAVRVIPALKSVARGLMSARQAARAIVERRSRFRLV